MAAHLEWSNILEVFESVSKYMNMSQQTLLVWIIEKLSIKVSHQRKLQSQGIREQVLL